jgi:hypothetical protein
MNQTTRSSRSPHLRVGADRKRRAFEEGVRSGSGYCSDQTLAAIKSSGSKQRRCEPSRTLRLGNRPGCACAVAPGQIGPRHRGTSTSHRPEPNAGGSIKRGDPDAECQRRRQTGVPCPDLNRPSSRAASAAGECWQQSVAPRLSRAPSPAGLRPRCRGSTGTPPPVRWPRAT